MEEPHQGYEGSMENINSFLFISEMAQMIEDGNPNQFPHLIQESQPSPPVGLPQPAQPLKRKKKKEKPVSQACIICSHDHASCDDCMFLLSFWFCLYKIARPCKRCTAKGFPHLCKNAMKTKPAKKGRPARVCLQLEC